MERKVCSMPGYEDLYYIYEDGSVFSVRKQRFMKPIVVAPYNYIKYFLTGNDKRRWYSAHQLVAYHWISPCPEGKEVNHKDHNRANNHYSNLEYVTHSENILKAYRDGQRTSPWTNTQRIPPSIETRIKISNAKLKPCISININTNKKQHFESVQQLCDKLKINRRTFNRAINNNGLCKQEYVVSFVSNI